MNTRKNKYWSPLLISFAPMVRNNLPTVSSYMKTVRKCDTINFKSRVSKNQLFSYYCVMKRFKIVSNEFQKNIYTQISTHMLNFIVFELCDLIKSVTHHFYQNEDSTIKTDDKTLYFLHEIDISHVRSFIKVELFQFLEDR